MARKRITQLLPWLLPLRKKQRLLCFYLKMRLDGNHYPVSRIGNRLPHLLFETSSPLYNTQTGFDMVYQENKVFNLKLAAATIDKTLIKPGETFSFWQLVRYADRTTPYRDGLKVIDGNLITAPGGGLCQLSNLLFSLFLHSPLTVVERHGHGIKDFPDPPGTPLIGADAAISEGWMDLKIRNKTEGTFQISITFDKDYIRGRLLADHDSGVSYTVKNGKAVYYRKNGGVFEEVDILQDTLSGESGEILSSKKLYRNRCRIGYPLPDTTKIIEKGR